MMAVAPLWKGVARGDETGFDQERTGVMKTALWAVSLFGMLLLVGGLGLVGFGLRVTGIPEQMQMWKPDGWLRFKHFVTLVGPVVAALPFVFWRREALGSVVAGTCFLIALLGIVPVVGVGYLLVSCLCLGHLVLGRNARAEWGGLQGTTLCTLVGLGLLVGVLNVTMHFRVNT